MGPYVELHLHLDGAITPAIARKLAALQSITLETDDDKELTDLLSVPATCRDLNDFLKCFALPLTLLQTPEGISEAVYLVLENAAREGVIYAELRFAPQLHCENGLTQEEVVKAALNGLKRVSIPANLILCCMRAGDNQAENEETIRLAAQYLTIDGGVTAADLAGAEALFPASDFEPVFALARKLGVPFTLHAGEASGAESVRVALDMGASRIGHGVRSIEDEELIQELIRRQIPLEMCPISNLITHVLPDMNDYPLIDLLNRGVMVTVNTDDPGIVRSSIAGEFQYLREHFGLTDEQEKQIVRNAVLAAFTGPETRSRLLRQIG